MVKEVLVTKCADTHQSYVLRFEHHFQWGSMIELVHSYSIIRQQDEVLEVSDIKLKG